MLKLDNRKLCLITTHVCLSATNVRINYWEITHEKLAYFPDGGVRTYLTHLVWVRHYLLSQLKSTSQSITCAQVSQSIDNDLVD